MSDRQLAKETPCIQDAWSDEPLDACSERIARWCKSVSGSVLSSAQATKLYFVAAFAL